MMDWLANAENFLSSRPSVAIALVAAAALLALIAWMWGPVLLTSRHKYDSRRERIEDADRYRRNIGQLLIIPLLVAAALYTLLQVSRAARESVEKNEQQQYAGSLQALAGDSVAARLAGIHALAQTVGGDRADPLCPDGNQRPLSSQGAAADAAFSIDNRLYRVALQGIAAQAVTSSHLDPIPGGNAARREQDEASHDAVVGADIQAALAVIARRGCEPYSKEVPLNLARGYFRGVSMAYAQLAGSDLRGTDLSASELYLANFYRAILDKADLGGSNLTRASFANASLAGANFGPDRNLASPNLSRLPHLRTQLGRAQIVTANAQSANFQCAMMNDARLDDSELARADFRRATLARATLLGARGAGARFDAACGPRANFSNPAAIPGKGEVRRSDFSGADFSDGFFRAARFDRIDLRGASFVRADLTGATFENSDLSNADFRGANLTGVKFDGANLVGVKMGGAVVCDVTGLPDTIAPPNCGAQFIPLEAARFGDACVPAAEADESLAQQCPADAEEAVTASAPATTAN
ncbi:pentapeptide repeat-containing protein [Inquilinus sp.]|uniref:pentapeptide repeat-containing protein n=1 Tax=Inquilinus sp. TaxID=1932117 RepID=UPI0031DD9FEE